MEYMNVMVKVIIQFYVINKEWEVNEKKEEENSNLIFCLCKYQWPYEINEMLYASQYVSTPLRLFFRIWRSVEKLIESLTVCGFFSALSWNVCVYKMAAIQCNFFTGGGRKRGRCKWFNVAKGWGFVTPDDGTQDVFVHQVRNVNSLSKF